MNARDLVFAIPVFFALMGVEAVANRARFGDTRYRFVDTLSNLGCGVGQQVLGVFVRGVALGGYTLVYRAFHPAGSLVRLPGSWGGRRPRSRGRACSSPLISGTTRFTA